nr:adenine deaminase C-terminal domain-containing protein [Alicyclobacillus contaminans]
MRQAAVRRDLVEVARGERAPTLWVRGGRVVNVYSGEILPADVAVYKDRIAYVGQRPRKLDEQTVVVDATDMLVTPGFIESHAHPWVLYNPRSLTEKVVPLGTTTIVHDNLFFYLHFGAEGFARLMDAVRALPGLHLWLIRLVSQAEYPGEHEEFAPARLKPLLDYPDVVGTAEVTRWPMLYDADAALLEVIDHAKALGKISDGHTSGCSYERLNAIVAAGISACHEAIRAEEVLDRLRLGLWTTLRNSSLRPDLPEIVRAVTEHQVHTHRLMMTTDGPHPGFIEENGFVDGLLRRAVELGVPPVQAIQMVTLNPAVYLGLDEHIGGIAPGRRADMVLLPDLRHFRPRAVVAGGRLVAEHGRWTAPPPGIDWHAFPETKPITVPAAQWRNPALYRHPAPASAAEVTVPVIHFKSAVITERRDVTLPVMDGAVDLSQHSGLIFGALLERSGAWLAHGLLANFLDGVEGLASTYNTTTHILAMGRNPQAMAQAAARVSELGGGIVLVENGQVVLEIPLPLAGMMTDSGLFDQAAAYYRVLADAVAARGYPFHDILYSLLFLTCDNLPGLRLTPHGLLDVKTKKVLLPSVKNPLKCTQTAQSRR